MANLGSDDSDQVPAKLLAARILRAGLALNRRPAASR
jgi:hypothetical protein